MKVNFFAAERDWITFTLTPCDILCMFILLHVSLYINEIHTNVQ